MNPLSSPVRRQQQTIPGFRPSPRPKRRPIPEMTIRELKDLHNLNSKILASPGASSSTTTQRILSEQAAIESRLLDVEGVETINAKLKKTKIKGEGDMEVDEAPEPPTSRVIEAKRKALALYGASRTTSLGVKSSSSSSFTVQDAMDLERQAFLQDKERQERMLEKKKRLGMPIKGEVLSREEREARIWAFLNAKPTDSDLEDEDEDDEDEDDDDPASWFEDDQDDGRKGQDIIEPDEEDLSHIIRIDDSRIPYNGFYGYSNEGD